MVMLPQGTVNHLGANFLAIDSHQTRKNLACYFHEI